MNLDTRQPAYHTSSSCRATVEDFYKVSSGKATLLDSGVSAVIGKIQSIFIFGQLKVIPLFRNAVFHFLPVPISGGISDKHRVTKKH